MTFSFLPTKIASALDNLNCNYLTEIRMREGQPIIVEYKGRQYYLGEFGATERKNSALTCHELSSVLSSAMENSVYVYTEQLKNGFITVDGGIRIGICGEYVTDGGTIKTVQKPTSLNIRIPHDAVGCAKQLYELLNEIKPKATLLFSPPGYGKTTILRDYARHNSMQLGNNVLIFDERYEIYPHSVNESPLSFNANCDVIRGGDKLSGFANAVRVMKPNFIICDELYGENDFKAIKFAVDCSIAVMASTHICDRWLLKKLPFDCFIELTGIGKQAVVYDKDFNIVGNCDTFSAVRGNTFCG